MEMLLFCGIQASGKSTFYKNHFFNSHVRISLDLLRTRNKEDRFLDLCFSLQQKIVIDNTNPTVEERKKYIDLAQRFKYQVKGYFFESTTQISMERNALREGKERIPDLGILSTAKKMQMLTYDEGFDEIFKVSLSPEFNFSTQLILK